MPWVARPTGASNPKTIRACVEGAFFMPSAGATPSSRKATMPTNLTGDAHA